MVSNPSVRRWSRGTALLCLGLAVLLAGLLAADLRLEVHASSLTVTNTNDAGPRFLAPGRRRCCARRHIEFALTYPATITLTTGELSIAKPLSIAGPGPGQLAVSGNGASRVFRVDAPGGSKQIEVTISGLTLRDGQADGGGGAWNDEKLAMTDVVFLGNAACETSGSGCNGGGLYNTSSNPVLTDVAFIGNKAGSGGGGIFNTDHSNPVLSRVTFHDNQAGAGGGGMFNHDYSNPTLAQAIFKGNSTQSLGGGMYNTSNSSPMLTDAAFSGNSARFYGGGMYNSYGSSPIVTNATFLGNTADIHGGGMGNSDNSSPRLTNILFGGNLAGSHGGAMYNYEHSSPVVTNVTFNGNVAKGLGGGIYNNSECSPAINNSILWGNLGGTVESQIHNAASTPNLAYSDVQGSGGSGAGWDAGLGSDGGGNLDGDPQFVEPLDPGSAPTSDGDLHLQWGSPAIDAGDNSLIPAGVTTDLDGKSRIAKDRVDLGAYEVQFYLHLPMAVRVIPLAERQQTDFVRLCPFPAVRPSCLELNSRRGRSRPPSIPKGGP